MYLLQLQLLLQQAPTPCEDCAHDIEGSQLASNDQIEGYCEEIERQKKFI
jgi:hypothetical protein